MNNNKNKNWNNGQLVVNNNDKNDGLGGFVLEIEEASERVDQRVIEKKKE